MFISHEFLEERLHVFALFDFSRVVDQGFLCFEGWLACEFDGGVVSLDGGVVRLVVAWSS